MTETPNQTPSQGEHTLFLTIAEVAHELRCTSRHIQNLIARGELPHARFGRSVRVPRSALVALAQDATSIGARRDDA